MPRSPPLRLAIILADGGKAVVRPHHVDFHVEDLFDLIFPADIGRKGYLCMIYHCFLDDSKDAEQDKVFVSAGFIGDREDWISLRIAWRKRLKEDGLDYFKTSEYKMLRGQFEKFRQLPKPEGRKAAERVKHDLQQIVKRHSFIKGIGVAVNVADYRKVCMRPEVEGVFGPNPYHRALESVMFQTCKIIRRDAPGRNMVAFVHDEEDDFGTLHDLYKDFRGKNPKTSKLMGGFTPLSDKLHPPLQMADMIANDVQGRALEYLDKGKLNMSDFEMRGNLMKVGIWNESYMLSVLKSNLVRAGKPVPLDMADVEY